MHRLKPLLPAPTQIVSTAFFTIFFWTAIDAFAGLYLAAATGAAVVGLLAVYHLSAGYQLDDMIVFAADDGTPIATGRKLASHTGETDLHKAFSAFLFNSRGELLLQQRSAVKKTWPGVWSNSCCGHPMLHEAEADAVRRRLHFELGIRNVSVHEVLPDFRYKAELGGVVENELCPVFVAFSDESVRPEPTEVGDIKWLEWNAALAMIRDPANGFSPWAIGEVELLARSKRFVELMRENTSAAIGDAEPSPAFATADNTEIAA